MFVLGTVITLITGFIYSLRFSFIKDLNKSGVSNSQINLYYRLISLPVLLLTGLLIFKNVLFLGFDFWFWLLISIFVNVFWGIFQIYIYQKSPFSSVESLQFLNIVFSTVAGMVFFGEFLSPIKIIGILLIVCSLFILLIRQIANKKLSLLNWQIIFYYLLATVADIVNKKAISASSPLIYSICFTSLISLSYAVIIFIKHERIYKFNNIKNNKFLILVGVFAAISFLGINYGYKLLPLGVVITLFSSRVFFSMWLSKNKYGEHNLAPKLIASAIAVVGVGIMFI